jgi:hypothetical protein
MLSRRRCRQVIGDDTDGLDNVSFNNATVGAAPELSTWAMMILGFSAIGFMAFRRKNRMAFNEA